MASNKKPKCKYWDKCYQKNPAHKKNFQHPGDNPEDDEPPSKEPDVKVPHNLELVGKKVVFFGEPKGYNRKQAEDKSKDYGCVPSSIISHKTDYVILGGDGKKSPDASRLGIQTFTQAQWEKILSKAVAVKKAEEEDENLPEDTKPPPLEKKRSAAAVHAPSDGGDTDTEMDTSEGGTAKAAKRKRAGPNDHDISDEEDDGKPPLKKKRSSKAGGTQKEDTGADAASGDAATASPQKPTLKRQNTRGKKQKCIFWDKCYRKDPDHREMYIHPGDPDVAYDEDDVDDRGKKESNKPKIYRLKHKAGLKVMLAHKWTDAVDPKGWWLSEKLDGVRAYWDGKTFYSRLGNEFIAPPWFTKGLPSDMELDGELFGGRGKFQSTVSIVKTPEDSRWSQITYQIFDVPSIGTQPCEKRFAHAKEYFEKNRAKYVRVLDQIKCKDEDHLKEELKRIEAMGGEGVMLRQPGSKYERTRSKALLKLKSFHDAEAEVIGYEPSKTAPRLVGALRCVMACGKEFKVGSGLCDMDRRHPPKIGSIITYRFQEYTNSGSPRFPTFVGVRIDADKPSDVILPKKGD